MDASSPSSHRSGFPSDREKGDEGNTGLVFMCMLGGVAEDGERDKEEGKRAQAAQCPTLCHTDEWDSGIPRTHMPVPARLLLSKT